MEQLDIPLFVTNSSSTDFQLSQEEIIPQILSENSLDKVLNHIKNLSEADKQKQLYFIQSAFAARFLQQPKWPDYIESDSTENNGIEQTEDTFDCDLLIKQAIRIAEVIENQAIRGENNSLAWLGLVYNTATSGFRFQTLDQFSLADGNLGIALFIAALAKITGDERWHNLALQILKPIESALKELSRENKSRFVRILGIGGFNGLGTSAYSLIQIAELLSEPSLIPIADDIVTMITIDEIVNSSQLDIISGCGGTLLSLLGCLSSKIDNSSEYLRKAIVCGDYLLQHQAPSEAEISSRSLGFWSGIAGIAYALLRLYEVTQDERYLTTAKNAIALESKATNFHDSNLTQLKIEIAFGRLGGINLLNNSQIRNEINTAIEIIQQHKIWGVDNLFWGNYGRLELLLVASEKLGKPELKTLANNWVNEIAAKTASNKLKLCVNSDCEISHPGLLHGTAGIGYQLLRIAYPKLLPSILLLQ
jgi:type 2 lantibiotic biosynthesis protein LanM